MTLHVVDPGLYTMVVDRGRQGSRSLGVPVGGAADQAALAVGNALVGNPPDAAALEITLAGPTLTAACELACVVHGAPFALTSDRQPLTAGKTFTLEPGERLQVGSTATGMRAYLCVRGGLQTPALLGCRSALEPLRTGADLPCLPGRLAARFVHLPAALGALAPGPLRVLDGPQAHWFDLSLLQKEEFRVSASSNRMGLRLEGRPLPWQPREMVSEPVCPGAVQVTRDGRCIILGVDGQTIGGYPRIAQVIAADLDRLGQLRPGDVVRFARVGLEQAETLYRERQELLREWLARLGAFFP
jgi:antagonist of KipI